MDKFAGFEDLLVKLNAPAQAIITEFKRCSGRQIRLASELPTLLHVRNQPGKTPPSRKRWPKDALSP
jgi:hypothetical protein